MDESPTLQLPRCDPEVLRDLLELVGYSPPLRVICAWTDGQCERVEIWAAAHHARASDNICRVPRRPRCLLQRYRMSYA